MKDANFLSVLKRSITEQSIVSIYSNRNQPDKCSVGFIEKISAEQVIMKHISPHGFYDGYVIRRLSDIFRVDINGQYEQRLFKLYNLNDQKHQDLCTNKTTKNCNLFKEALIAAKNLEMVISVCIDETEEQEDIVGWVKEVNESQVIISNISFEGLDDGDSIFYIQDIVKINCDSIDEKVLGLLNLNQKD